jgi:hypothetical protein
MLARLPVIVAVRPLARFPPSARLPAIFRLLCQSRSAQGSSKPGEQATVFVEITEATLQALPGILNPRQDGYHATR